jgi:hypothetical protein
VASDGQAAEAGTTIGATGETQTTESKNEEEEDGNMVCSVSLFDWTYLSGH